MGIDTPDIRYVVHWRPPQDVEQYVQATGRGGRDGSTSHAVLLYSKGLKHHVEETIVAKVHSVVSKFCFMTWTVLYITQVLVDACVVIFVKLIAAVKVKNYT